LQVGKPEERREKGLSATIGYICANVSIAGKTGLPFYAHFMRPFDEGRHSGVLNETPELMNDFTLRIE